MSILRPYFCLADVLINSRGIKIIKLQASATAASALHHIRALRYYYFISARN